MPQELIRNFSIIAHIDHGKSTLADRILEITRTLSEREMREQVLDSMDLERERGITIKAQAARISYQSLDGQTYVLNLIDTPGHVDFHYEVSRSLAACEGAILVVDAAQGVEAQTIANLYKAVDEGLEIIPVMNKIDLPNADPESTRQQIMELVGCFENEIFSVSAKDGSGVSVVLEEVVRKIPPPSGKPDAPLRGLVVDSIYNTYRGVVAYIRVVDGQITEGQKICLMATDQEYEVLEVGIFTPKMVRTGKLEAGEVGYFIANIKTVADLRVGDTVTDARVPAGEMLPGYEPVKPVVFCGLFPVESSEYEELRDALDKLHLNDSGFMFEPETSTALGFGFRCGFLGTLHMDIAQERLEREYDLSLVITAPNVVYEILLSNGEVVQIDNPAQMPNPGKIEEFREPYIHATILTDQESVGGILKICSDRRGEARGMEYLPGNRVILRYDLPLAEVVLDFHDKIKSVSRGYASYDYEVIGFRAGPLVKLDILLNGEPVDALSLIVHEEKAYSRGKALAEKLRQVVPRQLFDVAIQAAIGNKVIARENVRALRKNVTAKCYGGDITRKRKLLQRQREGKRRMKQVGNVELPQDAFLAVLNVE
ncbi:MAG: translation elongation factor 4 [Candidatus Omnitrophica bacterium]|nr:MAG: Elongation factor 4 [Candidatus Hinthialibacteria bacterium OLB16]MCK6496326.1 translation elongation factor 4 [bacterium]MCL4734462.1 translation elongation factor 4 [Candidatus Omnitrophota bacterium]NUP92958.1 elongation factor 4 [Candidatus Omnitrophota bacterium]